MGLTIQNLVRQPTVPAQIEFDKDTVRYGKDDNFPLRLARLVQNSPTASSCIDTKCDFIEGSGFSEASLSELIVNNRNERFGDVHSSNSEAFGTFDGLAIRVLYNQKGNITEIFSEPFEYCRLGKPDSKGIVNKIYMNPYFGTGEYNKKYTKCYDVYNPTPKVVLAQQARDGSEYKGQILYFATTSPLSRFYPAPKYYACSNWMSVDEAIGGFHKNNVDNNFFQSAIINMIGDENQPSTHPDDQIWDEDSNSYQPNPKLTQAYRFNIEMQKFTGWEKAGNIMTLWGRTKEEMPQITAFPSNTNADLFKTLQDLVTEQIARATKVPSVLANIQSGASLGGDGNNIRASVKLMQQNTSKERAMLERLYKELLSHFEKPYTGEVKILNYNPFPEMQKIDPLVWAALPVEVQLAWIKKNTDFEIPDAAPTAQPAPAQNSFSNIFYADYPAGAQVKAKKALDFRIKMNSNCGTKGGWAMCEDIIGKRPIAFKGIKRIYNYLNKNRTFENALFSDSCESLLYSAWGGSDMLDWASNKIASINE